MSPPDPAPAHVRVLVRVRPFNDREAQCHPASVLEIEDGGMATASDCGAGADSAAATRRGRHARGSRGTITVIDPSGGAGGHGGGHDGGGGATHAALPTFTYDAVFGPQSQQIEIFDSLKGIIDAVGAGYNGTIVAYGQTGSGKTHTIFGDAGLRDSCDAGLIQRSLTSIFRKISEQCLVGPNNAGTVAGGSVRTSTKASFFEIYNERVYDLLSPNAMAAEEEGKGLPVREDAAKGVYVEGLIEKEVYNTMDAMEVLRCGTDNRRVAATNMNRVSSRSHAIFILRVSAETTKNGVSKMRTSKFTMVDLAGSERQKATATEGERLKEASMINNSLLCLGQVIHSLADREKGNRTHVPFRDSKLTFLLRDSFGGNSKTGLVATVTPSISSLPETLSTLKFAQRAKFIKNAAVLNESTRGSVAALQKEVARLKAELEAWKNSPSVTSDGGKATPGAGFVANGPAATDATVSAPRNQNSNRSKIAKGLNDASNHTPKRKLQQEMFVHKFNSRLIRPSTGAFERKSALPPASVSPLAPRQLVNLNTPSRKAQLQVLKLQEDLGIVKDYNRSLMQRLESISDTLKVKQTRLEDLECEKNEALKQLEITQERSNSDLASFQLQEETLKAEIKRGNSALESLQGKVNAAEEELTKTSEENIELQKNFSAPHVLRSKAGHALSCN